MLWQPFMIFCKLHAHGSSWTCSVRLHLNYWAIVVIWLCTQMEQGKKVNHTSRLCPLHFANLFSKSKRVHLWNLEKKNFILLQKLFLFSRKSNFRILGIQILWNHQMLKHKIISTFYWITLEVNTVW